MPNEQDPVVLELASLPREQLGPFLVLGVDKTADQEQIEANWAQRVLWARKKQIRLALPDINWAREVIQDAERRVRADAASLNPDTSDGLLGRLMQQYGAGNNGAGRPLDVEKSFADYLPAVEIPDAAEVRAAIPVPEIPAEVPVVPRFLHQLVEEPIHPWSLDLPTDSNSD
jgi:hypothetical protein